MKKLLLLASFAICSAQADVYVSPLEYKDFECDELKEEYTEVSKASLDAFLESIEMSGSYAREAAKNHEEFEAHENAMLKAGVRKKCQWAVDKKEQMQAAEKASSNG